MPHRSTASAKYPQDPALGALHSYFGTEDRDNAVPSELTLPIADRLVTHLLLDRPPDLFVKEPLDA
jgi:hypothetical protein